MFIFPDTTDDNLTEYINCLDAESFDCIEIRAIQIAKNVYWRTFIPLFYISIHRDGSVNIEFENVSINLSIILSMKDYTYDISVIDGYTKILRCSIKYKEYTKIDEIIESVYQDIIKL